MITYAVLYTIGAIRSGYGRLSLSAIARCLPTLGSQKSRFKRLSRFLANKHLCPEAVAPAWLALVLGSNPSRRVPILVDQTYVAGTPTIMAGIIHRGRVLPVAFTTFEHALLRRSQNTLETALLTLVVASMPPGLTPIFTGDRAYGRYQLICALNQLGQLYVLRGKKDVVLWQEGQERFPRHFRAKVGVPRRYTNLGYRKRGKEPVDLIVYRGRGFREPWYLLVPAGSEAQLPTDAVVEIYRSRMHIEQGFRDWKTHLGVRGLQLKTDVAVRLCRLLLTVTLAYICLVLLGSSAWVQEHYERFETLRQRPRHGTRRTLSVLSHGMLMWAAPDLHAQACRILIGIIDTLAHGGGAYEPLAALPDPQQ